MPILNSLVNVPDGRRRRVILAVLGVVSVLAGVLAGVLVISQREDPGQNKVALVREPTPAPVTTPAVTATPRPSAEPTKKAASTIRSAAVPSDRPATPAKTRLKTSDESGKTGKIKPATTAPPSPEKVLDTSGSFLIRNSGTGFCIDLPGYGAVPADSKASQWHCSAGDGDNQEFEFAAQADGGFLIRNRLSQLCLQPSGTGAMPSGSELFSWECIAGDADNMVFQARASGKGWKLVNLKTGLCLDVSTASGAADQPDQLLALSTCSAAAHQVWTLVR